MTAVELVQDLRARGITLRADGDLLRYRPASALSVEDVDRLRAAKAEVLALLRDGAPTPAAPAPPPETPVRDLIAAYKTVLTRLYELAALGPDADPAECRQLLQEQMRLHDDLGPEFAEAVDRQHARAWAAREQRCPSCGLPGVFHDPTTGETIALDLAAIVRFTAGPRPPVPPETGAHSPRDPSGWLVALPGLGPRRVGPYTPCRECGAGTFATYGDRPLCRPCADAWGPR